MRFFKDSWESYSFGDLFHVTNGINKEKESFGVGYPIVNYMDVNKHAFLKKDMIFGLVNSTQTEQCTYSILPNDLIVTRTSETIDEIAYSSCLLEEIPNCVFSGFLLRARPLTNKTHTVFMVYELRSETYRKILKKYSTETSRALINSDNLKKVPLRIPSLKNQQKIASFLILIDERIETQSKIIEKLQSQMNCIIDSIVDFSAPQFKFKDLYTTAGEGGTPSTSNNLFYENGNIPFIKIEDLSNKYLKANKDFITEQGLKSSSAWMVPANSIIYSNGATIGRISINTYPVSTKQGILGIIPSKIVLTEYLYYFMKSEYFRKQVHRITVKGTMDCAYLKDLNFIKCYIPCLDRQENIIKTLTLLDEKIVIEQIILNKLKEQKKFLLSNMFI